MTEYRTAPWDYAMPLSTPASRDLLHLRDIQLRGYQREDGLFDIEAHLLDTKAYAFRTTIAASSRPASRCTACGCA